jgi:phenylalanyl-tRNA synthetase alpha chain
VPDGTGEPAEVGPAPVTLSEPERRLLLELRRTAPAPMDEGALEGATGLDADRVRGALQRLRSKHLANVAETHRTFLQLTPRGEVARARRLPERRLLDLLVERGEGVAPTELAAAGLDAEERSAAVGILRRRGYLHEGVPFRLRSGAPDAAAPLPEETTLAAVASATPTAVVEETVEPLKRRGLIAAGHETRRAWSASAEGMQLPIEAGDRPLLGALTPALLASGAWREAGFRPYDVRADVPFVTGARPHPYAAWLDEFEEILVGLGFEQAEGPLLETEFWNADVLFMPQEHPARSIHDVLSVRGVEGRPPPPALLERVAAVHEGRALPGDAGPITPGWRAPYDPAIARQPVLRSQTTAVSARFLAARPDPPVRMFCLDRNFRRESVDATHHVEFSQAEGIIAEEGISLRHLVGTFQALAEAIGIRSLRLRPSYFPFTEPSIEGYVKHPTLGWIEVFPGGMFRPEVLRPLGVTVPVAAWGIGIARLAMVALGVRDIRELFSDDLGRLTSGRF